MEPMVKLAACGIIAVILSVQLKNRSREMSFLISLTACTVILFTGLAMFSPLADFMNRLSKAAEIDHATLGVLKHVCAVMVLTNMVSSFCRDAGENGVGQAIEFCGSLAAAGCALPLLDAVLENISGLLGG